MHRTTQSRLLITLVLCTILAPLPIIQAREAEPSPAQQQTPDKSFAQISLQEQINNAHPGTTLLLPSITYTEVLTIDKPLHIKGEGPFPTFLHPTSTPNGYALHITAENVTLSNLDIMNDADGLYTTGVKITAEKATLEHCTFHDTPIGIALWSSKNTITHCDFQRCTDEGIVLLGTPALPCTNNTISSCHFTQNCDGIELQHASRNHIFSCTFTDNSHAGIDAIESNNNDNSISNCTFRNNQAFGAYLARSARIFISHCIFSDDALMFVHTTSSTIYQSQITKILLLNESSLLLIQCNETTTDHIIAKQSSFEMRKLNQTQAPSEEKAPITRSYQLLLFLLTYLKTFKTIRQQAIQARM